MMSLEDRTEPTSDPVSVIREALEFSWLHLDENGWLVSHGNPKVALAQLVKEREALRVALERMAHEHCGTNRVSQNVRWARQALGWEYDKGCAESVEAVRVSHGEIDLRDVHQTARDDDPGGCLMGPNPKEEETK